MLETVENIKVVKGIGDKTATLYGKLGIKTIGDLLGHYPFRYETFSYPTPIGEVKDNGQVIVQGYLGMQPVLKNMGRKTVTIAVLRDSTGSVNLKWFNAPYIRNTLKPGILYVCVGTCTCFRGQKFISQPKVYTALEYKEIMNTLQPVYRLTEGLSQNNVRKACRQAVTSTKISDCLTNSIKKEYDLVDLKSAYRGIHSPESDEDVTRALKRLVFDEFLAFFINLRGLKDKDHIKPSECQIKDFSVADDIINSLPFEMTKDQASAFEDIKKDLSSGLVMQRLLQGDVGSGKTLIAELSLALAAKNGYQGCILAPTEVLAKQHFEDFSKKLEPIGIRVALLISKIKASEKKAILADIASGKIDIVVGTHAAITDKVEFAKLGLCVIDEQHRFGVKQREALQLKGQDPHVLLMSATPIPRTYALMLYGDMDVSTIKTMPEGRLPIKNSLLTEEYREKTYHFISRIIKERHQQAYIICPLVEESDKLSAAAVTNYIDGLREYIDDDITVDIMHGKLKTEEKNQVMEKFASGQTDILVSTTVIEVGVNVPNATVMLIENAENFGLAQLHQIRGRVGRGKDQSYCLFMLGKDNDKIKERMDIIVKSNDGFYIASQDMKLRGPGDFFGVRQSGERQFELADPLRDGSILAAAKECSERMSEDDIKTFFDNKKLVVSIGESMVY